MSFAICFAKKKFTKKEDVLQYVNFVKKNLIKCNVNVMKEEDSPDEIILTVKGTQVSLEKKAAEEGYLKKNLKTGELDVFVVSKRNIFKDVDKESFMSDSEKMSLLYSVLDDICVDFEEVKNILPLTDDDTRLLHVSKREGKIIDVIPLHSNPEKIKLWKRNFMKTPIVDGYVNPIHEYYGSEVALYFAWMNHYIRWLSAPGLLGFFIWLHNKKDDSVSVDNSYLLPLFTIFMVCWAVLFIQFWKRKCALTTSDWGDDLTSECCCTHYLPDFSGELRECPITGKTVFFYPLHKRYLKYLKSIIVTFGMLIVAFSVMVISLNFQGYIHEHSYGSSFLHFPKIQQFSNPGAIFDPRGGGPCPNLLPLVPCVVHSIIIAILNGKYRSIAMKLTCNENHEKREDFEHSLIVKRFFFEAFDSYIALFFLAIVQADHILLRAELFALYTADSLRRIFTESVLPYILMKRSRKKNKVHSPLVEEIQQPEYEQFDDYLEMVIQFGYVTLFASAFPLAGILSLVSNLIEVRNDLFKLTYVQRRPRCVRTDNIEPWLSILQALVWLSIMTNVYIFAFTTEQMMQLFPTLFTIEESQDVSFGGSDHSHVLAEGKGQWVVIIAIAFEHALILFAKLFYALVPDVPYSVRVENKRREYRHAQLINNKLHMD